MMRFVVVVDAEIPYLLAENAAGATVFEDRVAANNAAIEKERETGKWCSVVRLEDR
jgi:hypothetical protein